MNSKCPEGMTRKSEMLDDILDSIDAAIFTVDDNSLIVYVNKECEHLLDTGRKALIGKNIWDVLPIPAGSTFHITYDRAKHYGKPSRFEYSIRALNKRFEVNINAIQNGMTVMLHDKTTQWHVDELYRLALFLLERLNESVFLVRSDGRLFHMNDETCRVLGYSRDELIRMKIFDIDSSLTVGGWSEYFNDIKVREHIEIESMLKTKNGVQMPVEECANYIQLYGNEYYCVAARDVSDRKRSEKALRESEANLSRAQSIAHIGSFDWDLVSDDIYWSDETYRIFGYVRGELKPTNEAFLNLIHPDDRELVARSMEDAFNKTTTPYTIDYRIIRRDGSERFIRSNAEIHRDSSGKPIRMIGTSHDITERKRAEETLEKYRLFSENARDIALFVRRDGRILEANKAAVDIYGYTYDELLSLSVYDLRADDPGHYVDDQMNTAFDKGILFEALHRRKDGSTFPVEVNSQGRVINGQKVLLSVVRDITERKHVEVALKKSEANLKNAQRITHMGNYTLDLKNDRAICSEEFYRILGLAPREYFSYRAYLAMVHPDDKELFNKVVQDAIAQGKDFNTDSKIVMPDGTERVVHADGEMILDESGKSIQMFGTIQDITERKTVEESLKKLSRAIEEGPGVVVITDVNGIIEYVNPKFTELTGYTTEEAKGKNPNILKSGETSPEEYRRLWDTILRGKEWRGEFHNRRKNGELYWESAIISPFKDKGGKITHFIAIKEDITERKKNELELKKAKSQVEMYNDLLGHDINNMNQVGIGYLEMAIDKLGLNEEDKKLLSKPLEALINSSKLIDNVRKLQSIRSGEVRHKIIDVDQVLLDEIGSHSSPQERKIAINYEHASGCTVMANELLRDVFSNLVGNAIKHSKGPLEINIMLSKIIENGREYCRVCIEDNGPGIPDDIKSKLFTRFQRGDTKATGKGLGLYLVKTLVEDFHGKVWVEDRVSGDYGRGSRFVILLPALNTTN